MEVRKIQEVKFFDDKSINNIPRTKWDRIMLEPNLKAFKDITLHSNGNVTIGSVNLLKMEPIGYMEFSGDLNSAKRRSLVQYAYDVQNLHREKSGEELVIILQNIHNTF